MPDDLDVVQHPTLGTLKFPKSMPFDQRNSIIAGMVKSAPVTMDETGGEALHRHLQNAATSVGQSVDDNDMANLRAAAHGAPTNPGAIVWSTYGPRMLRSILQSGADMTTPAGAATTAGVALANTNPVTGIPVDAALALHGGYGVYKNRAALKDLATTGQANPDQLQSALNSGAELAGGAAGTGALIKSAGTVPVSKQNASAQTALDPGWGKRQALQQDLAGARPYLGGRGVKGVADLQETIPGAKNEIWAPAEKAFAQFGEEPVQGPDGPTTYNKLEARRQELSAQLQGIRDRDPAALQTVLQQGKNPANLADEQGAVTSLLDERMRQAGVNYPVVRSTFGSVKGIERQVSGTNTLSETPKRYGLGRMSEDLSLNPAKTVRGIAAGTQDILQGRPLWSGKPTDVGVAEGFTSGAPKPSFQTTTAPKPFGPALAPPVFPTPPPAEQVPTSGPGGNVALFPDIPSGQLPSVAHGMGEVPNWPPKTPDWSAPPLAPSPLPPVPSNGAPAPPTSGSSPVIPPAAASAPPTNPPVPGYRPSEKAATLSAAPRDLGPEFRQGQRTEMIVRYKDILRNPKATPADLSEANARLQELGAAQ